MLEILGAQSEYISASRASKLSGYSSDYIGQLCRAKKIPGQLIGRTWFVDMAVLQEYKRSKIQDTRLRQGYDGQARNKKQTKLKVQNLDRQEISLSNLSQD